MKKLILSIFLVVVLFSAAPAGAQQEQFQGPTYIVQPGDTLWTIARNLHVPFDDLLAVNNLTEESSFLPGTELLIPGFSDLDGVLTTTRVNFGDSLTGLSRKYQIPEQTLVRLNRLTSPVELYAGVSAVLIGSEESEPVLGRRAALKPGETVLERAVSEGVNPWELLLENGQETRWEVIPGEVLFVPGTNSKGPSALPEAIRKVQYSPDQFIQGKTSLIRIQAPLETQLEGSVGDYQLHFFPETNFEYVALQGMDAREALGITPISLSGTLADGTPFALQQMVRVYSGDYPYEDINNVPPETVSLELTRAEKDQLRNIARQVSDQKNWNGGFSSPVSPEYAGGYVSYFGNRRSYNGSGYLYVHSGLDFYSQIGDDILAAASGKVALVDDLRIYGTTTMINHGWGVYTLYAHQSQVLVDVGQTVSAGELIGKVGSTGRSTGPHLHWEVWVGGVQVDPLEWVNQQYP